VNRTSVDAYLQDGCGRCDRYQTPTCKVHRWTPALVALRGLLRSTALTEEMKWGSPCYTLEGKNVVMLASFNDSCALSFFKGAALVDEEGALETAGPNSHVARVLRFRSVEDALARLSQAGRFVEQAIALERDGVKVAHATAPQPIPEELARRLAEDPSLRAAFEALTPGRRRSHILHVSGAAQAATRVRRVERCVSDILAGRGFNER
jgi:uncharacterized protein YdeI (YjbR/CyaY-like superfamily)